MESQKSEKNIFKNSEDVLREQQESGKVFINGVSLTTGKLERRKADFSSKAHLEISNELEKNN